MSLKFFFSPRNGIPALALHCIIRAGMRGEWLNWFSFLFFDGNNLRLRLSRRFSGYYQSGKNGNGTPEEPDRNYKVSRVTETNEFDPNRDENDQKTHAKRHCTPTGS
tara:strand:- start:6933 stop:7253 length:321 start_codon:yes stop_codon:yes gene_type:complete